MGLQSWRTLDDPSCVENSQKCREGEWREAIQRAQISLSSRIPLPTASTDFSSQQN
jgi:hypothetical protein